MYRRILTKKFLKKIRLFVFIYYIEYSFLTGRQKIKFNEVHFQRLRAAINDDFHGRLD